MIRTRQFTLAIALPLLIGSRAAMAQGKAPAKWADTISTEIDKTSTAGDLVKLQAARALAERVAAVFPDDGLILHYEAYALYREATLAFGRGGDPTALFERAQGIFERSLKLHPLPETHALMASIDGQLIGRNPSRAMELGIAAQASSQAALASGIANPRVWLVRGMGSLYTPEEYGGGLKPAKEQIERAIALFAKDAPKPGEPSWGRAEAYAWLGQVYEKTGDKAKAAEAYATALSIAPNYTFAKSLAAALK